MSATEKGVEKCLLSDQALRNELNKAIKNGCRNYQENLRNESGKYDRGIQRGWFFGYKHGHKGGYKSDQVSRTFDLQFQFNHCTDMMTELDKYFADDKTNYDDHSLAMFLLDELYKIIGSMPTKPGDNTQKLTGLYQLKKSKP